MSKEAMKLALEALEDLGMKHFESTGEVLHKEVFDVLKEALAKQEQGEPDDLMIAYMSGLHDGKKLAKKEQGEPVALKKGECWPEEVMRQWDYWRKEIANGHKGSAPRDWFEGLSELKLIDTTPQQRTWVGLTDEEMRQWWWKENGLEDCDMCKIDDFTKVVREVEAKLKEKNG